MATHACGSPDATVSAAREMDEARKHRECYDGLASSIGKPWSLSLNNIIVAPPSSGVLFSRKMCIRCRSRAVCCCYLPTREKHTRTHAHRLSRTQQTKSPLLGEKRAVSLSSWRLPTLIRLLSFVLGGAEGNNSQCRS